MTVIVIDTNILVSALISSDGLSRELLKSCFKGTFKPLMSNALFQECEAITRRKEILQRCPLTEGEIQELLSAYYSVCQWTPIYYLWRPNLKDEGDNFLVELAVAGNAACIITKNSRDLKRSELHFPSLRVLTPEELLRG